MRSEFTLNWLGRCRSIAGRQGRVSPVRDLEGLESRVVLSHVAHPVQVAAAVPTTLSPPWYSLRSEINATIGKTPGVVVSPLIQDSDSEFTVDITTKNTARGVALASVLSGLHTIGGVTVDVKVIKPSGAVISGVTPASAKQLGTLEEAALEGNKLFKTVVVQPSGPFSSTEDVYPVFTKSVVQYYNDNLADLYSNQNTVAADAFRDVLASNPGGFIVNPSTAQ